MRAADGAPAQPGEARPPPGRGAGAGASQARARGEALPGRARRGAPAVLLRCLHRALALAQQREESRSSALQSDSRAHSPPAAPYWGNVSRQSSGPRQKWVA